MSVPESRSALDAHGEVVPVVVDVEGMAPARCLPEWKGSASAEAAKGTTTMTRRGAVADSDGFDRGSGTLVPGPHAQFGS